MVLSYKHNISPVVLFVRGNLPSCICVILRCGTSGLNTSGEVPAGVDCGFLFHLTDILETRYTQNRCTVYSDINDYGLVIHMMSSLIPQKYV